MTDGTLILLLGLGLAALAVVPFVRSRRRRETQGATAAAKAVEHGLDVPHSLHPVIDVSKCLGCGACTRVCPEGDVLALIAGQAQTVAPARCVGHGLCERACPTEAITLVFGTATRGVELPRVREDYQTNVPGLYIVGELGGMGLIRNAFEQGRQAAEGIVRNAKLAPPGDALDVVVVGAGPAGLSVAISLERAGLRYAVVEKEADLGGAVRTFPRRKVVMTQPFTIPSYGTVTAREIPKEELVDLWDELAETTGVIDRIESGVTVSAIEPAACGFRVVSREGRAWNAHRVVLAIGRRGIPRKLGVPGEAQGHVVYGLIEPEAYAGRRALVVGGGDSAVEAAMLLADQPGTTVALSYRRGALSRTKAANAERFAQAVARGAVAVYWNTEVLSIAADHVVLADDAGRHTVPADDVFVFAGGELPTAFLREAGIELDVKFGVP
jgi:thioredoxin reductase/Pyruvate/2-oxoacid:ferredoxin oxidoreductase delta subunit